MSDTQETKPAPAQPSTGTVLAGRFELLEKITDGGLTSIFKATDREKQRTVIVKILHAVRADDKQSLKRFEHGVKTSSSFEHPNCANYVSSGFTEAGVPFLVTEYVEGVSLEQVLAKEGRLTADRCIRIFQQLCDVLAEAHKNGIVHRNIKPSNIILRAEPDQTETVFLLDFGIARGTNSNKVLQQLTQTKKVVGSPLYMSPEQFIGKNIDTRSDIYSLGCVTYECLTGQPPFTGFTIPETMALHLSKQTEPMRDRCKDAHIPEHLEALVARALSKDPQDRQQSVTEFAYALTDTSAKFDKAKHTSKKTAIIVPKQRKRKISNLSYIAIGLIAVAGLLVATFVPRWADNAAEEKARTRQEHVGQLMRSTRSTYYGDVDQDGMSDALVHTTVLTETFNQVSLDVSHAIEQGHFDRARSLLPKLIKSLKAMDPVPSHVYARVVRIVRELTVARQYDDACTLALDAARADRRMSIAQLPVLSVAVDALEANHQYRDAASVLFEMETIKEMQLKTLADDDLAINSLPYIRARRAAMNIKSGAPFGEAQLRNLLPGLKGHAYFVAARELASLEDQRGNYADAFDLIDQCSQFRNLEYDQYIPRWCEDMKSIIREHAASKKANGAEQFNSVLKPLTVKNLGTSGVTIENYVEVSKYRDYLLSAGRKELAKELDYDLQKVARASEHHQ